MSTVLVTGGAGFIGFHLAKKLLRDGYTVDLVDNLARGRLDDDLKQLLTHPQARLIEADLTDPGTFGALRSDYDEIYHLAAVIGVKNVMEQPDRVLRVNAGGTLNLLEWVRDTQGRLRRFLFSSTSEVYSGTLRHYGIPIPTPETVPLTIDDVQSPRATYAISKILGEAACHAFLHRYGTPFTIIRYHNVYGPRMGFAHVIPELMLRARAAEDELKVYSPDHTRAFCYVDDAVEATIRLAESRMALGEIIHVGNPSEEISIRVLADRIMGIVRPGLRIRPLENQPGSPSRRCPSTDKMGRLTSFQPRVSLEAGLRKTWRWYNAHASPNPE
jgi:nucleoside-diphosphate-sugar epimerase